LVRTLVRVREPAQHSDRARDDRLRALRIGYGRR
jgi:hypothetical protein